MSINQLTSGMTPPTVDLQADDDAIDRRLEPCRRQRMSCGRQFGKARIDLARVFVTFLLRGCDLRVELGAASLELG